jgi:hypothetical protein
MLTREQRRLGDEFHHVFVQQHLVLLARRLDLAISHGTLEVEDDRGSPVVEQVLHEKEVQLDLSIRHRVLDNDLKEAQHFGYDGWEVMEQRLGHDTEVCRGKSQKGGRLYG